VLYIYTLSFTAHLVMEQYITNCCPFIPQTWTSETNIYMWYMLEDRIWCTEDNMNEKGNVHMNVIMRHVHITTVAMEKQ